MMNTRSNRWTLPLVLVSGLCLATTRLPRVLRDEGEMHERMETIEEELGKLRRSLRSEEKLGESLATLAAMQEATLACKGLVPELVEGLPEGDQPAMKTAYRRMMVDFLTYQLELEAALLDGDADAVKAAFKKVRNMEDEGHERFTEEEE